MGYSTAATGDYIIAGVAVIVVILLLAIIIAFFAKKKSSQNGKVQSPSDDGPSHGNKR